MPQDDALVQQLTATFVREYEVLRNAMNDPRGTPEAVAEAARNCDETKDKLRRAADFI